MATIDEKRSYIEKIAQSVKGDAGEKISAKNIPFRRRNQQRVVENYASWMQGLGIDPSEIHEDPDGQGYEVDESDSLGIGNGNL